MATIRESARQYEDWLRKQLHGDVLEQDLAKKRDKMRPRDLDLKPYRDERDNEVLRRIAAALDKGPMRMGFRAYRVRDRRRRPAKKNSTS